MQPHSMMWRTIQLEEGIETASRDGQQERTHQVCGHGTPRHPRTHARVEELGTRALPHVAAVHGRGWLTVHLNWQ